MKLTHLALIAALAPLAAQAQDSAAPAPSPQKPVAEAPAPSPAAATDPTSGYRQAMDAMHKDMMIDYTGNADVDFVRGMIPHHQGAIDMARVELAHGTDPEIRKLAEDVIAAQEKEIAFMRGWLEKHAADAGKPAEKPADAVPMQGHDHGSMTQTAPAN